MGMHEQAALIENQLKQTAAAAAAVAAQPTAQARPQQPVRHCICRLSKCGHVKDFVCHSAFFFTFANEMYD